MWTAVEVIIAQRISNGWSQRSASTLSQPLQGVHFGHNYWRYLKIIIAQRLSYVPAFAFAFFMNPKY